MTLTNLSSGADILETLAAILRDLSDVKDGDKGDTGEQGAQGEQGERGETGLQGDRGEKGDVGGRGEKGDAGERGERGEVGGTGERGERGETGERGLQGERGEQGIQGEKGEKGDVGEKGEKGDRGETGLSGSLAQVSTFLSGGLKGFLPGETPIDESEVFQAAYDAGKRGFYLEGRIYWFRQSIFINGSSTYEKVTITGNGATFKRSAAWLTVNLTGRVAGIKWLFFNNFKKSAAVNGVVQCTDEARATGTQTGGLCRLFISGVTFDGEGARVGMVFGNRTSAWLTGVTMYRAFTLISWWEYSDTTGLIMCQGRHADGPTDAALIHQITPGDGLSIVSPKVDPQIAVAVLTNCYGAVIEGDVTGKVIVTRCRGIVFKAWHMEGRNMGVPCLVSNGSQVTIDSPVWYLRTAATGVVGMFEINDTTTDLPSDITLISPTLVNDCTTDEEVGALFHLASYVTGTKVRATGVQSMVLTHGASTWLTGTGPRATAAVSQMQDVLNRSDSRVAFASNNWELTKVRGSFRVRGTVDPEDTKQRVLKNPVLTKVAAMTEGNTGTLPAGSLVSYAVASRNVSNQFTLAVQGSTTPDTVRVNQILVTADNPSELVIWRKVGAGDVLTAPTAYAILPASYERGNLFDFGAHVNGVRWITTGIPTVPTANVTAGV